MNRPRINPIKRTEAPPDIERLFKRMDVRGKPPPNAHLTYARAQSLYKTWFPFATYLMPHSVIRPRYRQLIVMRTAFIWRSEYLWAQHAEISLRLSLLSIEELSNVSTQALDGWQDWKEAALLGACDGTKNEGAISNKTWSMLTVFLSEEELVELTFLIGQYILIATTVRSLSPH